MSDTYVDQSKDYVRLLGRRHAPEALARMLNLSPGALQNLWRGRIKSISVDVYARICEAVASELKKEIGRLEHDLALVVARSPGARDGEMAAVAAQIEAMKNLLKERL